MRWAIGRPYAWAVPAYCLVNLLFFTQIQPYLPLGDELLSNGDFARGVEDWTLQGAAAGVVAEEGLLTIEHRAATSTTLAQCWPASEVPRRPLLAAEARSHDVVRGTKSWHRARIDLVGYDAQGRGLYWARTLLLGLENDHPWRSAEALFQVPMEAQRVCLEISLYSASGRFQVRHLSLTGGEESMSYRAGRLLLLAGWAGMAAWLFPPLYRHYRRRPLGRWLLLAGILLLVGVLLPHELRQQLEAGVLDILAGIGLHLAPAEFDVTRSPWALWPAHWDLSKFSHLLGFALIAVLLGADRDLAPGRRISVLLLLAAASEILQFFIPLRTPRLSDLAVDATGIILGLGLAAVWRRYLLPIRK